MLQVTPIPISQADRKKIQEWLSHDGARLFVQLLEFKNAELTAGAGNKLVEDEEGQSNLERRAKEAELLANQARNVRSLINLLQEMRAIDYPFGTTEIRPTPSTQPTQPTP